MSKPYFDIGREHYQRREYEQAVEQFILGAVIAHDAYCMMWLGNCYEQGSGVAKDLTEAKDLYRMALRWISHRDTNGTEWLRERLECLKNVQEAKYRRAFYNGIGNVKVIKSENADEPSVRFNLDETVITISSSDIYHRGFIYARENLPERTRKWACDSKGRRFHDGYCLDTDYFSLKVSKGNTDKYIKKKDGNKLHLLYPCNAELEYIYVQETILKKSKELLFSLAQDMLPLILSEVSQKIDVPYKTCRVIINSTSYLGCNSGNGDNITLTAQCIQLPKKSLEALCIHELTHNFVNGHTRDFWEKMEELGGSEAVELQNNLYKENKWPYLRF